ESTKAAVLAHGYKATGVDEHLWLDVAGKKVAILSYTWGVNERMRRSKHDLFVVPFGHLDKPIDLARIARDLNEAQSRGADIKIVMVHWGYEFEYYPDRHFLQLARQIIALGADIMSGRHPLGVQPAELC